MLIRALIVEDEPLARQRLQDLIRDVPWLSCIGEAADGRTAVRVIDELRPDLVFLDIEMPEMNGLRVLEEIRERPQVIFTTAYQQHAVAAFEMEALDYLVKPFGPDRFARAVERVRRRLPELDPAHFPLERVRHALRETGPLSRLLLRDGDRVIPVPVEAVERLEADDDYIRVHTAGKQFLVYATLTDLAQRLDPELFLRVHRSHVVNLSFVSHLLREGSRFVVVLRDGTQIAASRARSQELRRLAL